MEKQQEITLNKDQFLSLIKIVYLGNWLANAARTGGQDDMYIREYQDIEQQVFSFAKKFGLEQCFDPEYFVQGQYFFTRDFEENSGLYELIQEYDDETFWEELSERLGQRDFYREYTASEISRMDEKERFLKLHEYICKWEHEIHKNGLKNISLTS